MNRVRATAPEQLAERAAQGKLAFQDGRLDELVFRWRARNFPSTLSAEEAERWQAHLAARRSGPEIVISDERRELLETGGGLKKARPLLGDNPVFVANIDSVWIDRGDALADLIRLWDPERMDAALLLAKREGAIGFEGGGDFFLGDDSRLTFRG